MTLDDKTAPPPTKQNSPLAGYLCGLRVLVVLLIYDFYF
jgi:hypothetical protein